ncbi:hypothetical protein L1987_02586 [Smallanthus sonchifolius]|uniref:Uncharacterized protein n=1 Tax=Smallanthus sonchifolius TaxID=185202 RepID=A0ACB9K8G7_9ASTR|nr:hypothetical protein L1987_02586 [Smallanthus sonchifolius]
MLQVKAAAEESILRELPEATILRPAVMVAPERKLSSHTHSASLSMLPWPKPAICPSVPSDASSEVLVKEKAIL